MPKKITRKMWAIKWPSGLIQVYPNKKRVKAAVDYWEESMVRPHNSFRVFRCIVKEE